MTITNNLVDGSGTLANSHISQEGIEIFGGDNVLISGNTIQNMGNAAINLVTIAAVVPDSGISNLQVFNNTINSSRIGIFLGSTYAPQNGPANLTNFEISGNVITNGFEGGIFIEAQDGIATDPTIFDNISIIGNQIGLHCQPITWFHPLSNLS